MTEHIEDREFDWRIAGDLDLVWRALTTAEGLSTWYVVEAEVDARPGGRLVADWGTGETPMGRFEEVEPHRRLHLAYGDERGAEEWLLEHDGGVTRVRLIHSLPLDDDSTWDETYPGIVRGWALFMGTLRFAVERVGRLGRTAEVRLGDVADGAWTRVLGALGLEATPSPGGRLGLGGRTAEVLVSVDGYSLLLAVDDEATLLVDVEGTKLYTVAATYGDDDRALAELRAALVRVAELACRAAYDRTP